MKGTELTDETLKIEHYLASRFDFAAPGDRQTDHFILRFDDTDRRDMHFTDETEAWAAYDQFAPNWNCYLFRLARLRSPPADGDVEGMRSALLYIAETSEDAHISRKAFEALGIIANGQGEK